MVGQANFDAQQLHLQETLPITVPPNTNEWHLCHAAGWRQPARLTTPNLFLPFQRRQIGLHPAQAFGPRLVGQRRKSKYRSLTPNGAYQLARQWLAAISVDVPALGKQIPAHRPPSHHQSGGALVAASPPATATARCRHQRVVSAPRPVPSLFSRHLGWQTRRRRSVGGG